MRAALVFVLLVALLASCAAARDLKQFFGVPASPGLKQHCWSVRAALPWVPCLHPLSACRPCRCICYSRVGTISGLALLQGLTRLEPA